MWPGEPYFVEIESVDGRVGAAYRADETGVHVCLRVDDCHGRSLTTWAQLGAATDVGRRLGAGLREAAFDLRGRLTTAICGRP